MRGADGIILLIPGCSNYTKCPKPSPAAEEVTLLRLYPRVVLHPTSCAPSSEFQHGFCIDCCRCSSPAISEHLETHLDTSGDVLQMGRLMGLSYGSVYLIHVCVSNIQPS